MATARHIELVFHGGDEGIKSAENAAGGQKAGQNIDALFQLNPVDFHLQESPGSFPRMLMPPFTLSPIFTSTAEPLGKKYIGAGPKPDQAKPLASFHGLTFLDPTNNTPGNQPSDLFNQKPCASRTLSTRRFARYQGMPCD